MDPLERKSVGDKGPGAQAFLTRALVAAGAPLVWFPIVATVAVAVAGSMRDRAIRFDYLSPAELFPFALIGGGLLLWAALRARRRRGPIGWGLAVMVMALVGSQALAVVTGLASGQTELAGWPRALILLLVGAYTLALAVVAVAGLLLARDLMRGAARAGPRPG